MVMMTMCDVRVLLLLQTPPPMMTTTLLLQRLLPLRSPPSLDHVHESPHAPPRQCHWQCTIRKIQQNSCST
jgi:hypothetical protein